MVTAAELRVNTLGHGMGDAERIIAAGQFAPHPARWLPNPENARLIREHPTDLFRTHSPPGAEFLRCEVLLVCL